MVTNCAILIYSMPFFGTTVSSYRPGLASGGAGRLLQIIVTICDDAQLLHIGRH